MKPVALILGASGRFSKNMIARLDASGWETRSYDRSMQNMKKAAEGVAVIVNGANPPYTHWKRDVLAFTKKVIEAAKHSGATVVMPGNNYCYGPQMQSPIGPDTPQKATNELGLIRIEMERLYKTSGVQTILLRAGDFLDTSASGNWFDLIMATKLEKGKLVYPGKPTIPHAWAYLPDMAWAAVQLLERREQLNTYEDISFPGYTMTGLELSNELTAITNQKSSIKPFDWWAIKLSKPFWSMAKHLLEMRYLWDTPHWMEATRFNELLPDFQPTPQREALCRAISYLPKFKFQPAELLNLHKRAA
ncbi:epimerase [Pseudovibrio sp. Tun.PSC04-5.I4]|uniref:epimerase n=1 Tax=Pseudovibrio sp. Tun.PSC04-5.I4 TaxID=1798213 RepID=UPI0008925DC2|nr:epimerase [Pseudovibrio sp. Tun.PSC04-5.I4]SDQ76835.1 Nucleoside-diphosphate-sugar epimerase [Pseudovibrio sp. Tun.PSC04-5.I4]